MLDRRTAIAALAAAGLAPRLAAAQTPTAQATGYVVGDMRVRVLSDGHMAVGLDRYAAAPTDRAAFDAAVAGVTEPRFAVNVVLIEQAGVRTLIDAGAGGTWVASAGKLGDALTAAGIDPATIDHVVLTHAHPDHLWGVIDDFDDSLRFAKARYTLPAAEFAFWMTGSQAEAAGAAAGVIAGARRVLKRIESKLALIAAESAVAPGLAYIDAAGHTPGQCAVLATSGTAHALIATDTLFHPVVSVAHPDWAPAQDMDGVLAARTRRRLLDLAAARQALVTAYHIEGAGRIERNGAAFRWQRQAS